MRYNFVLMVLNLDSHSILFSHEKLLAQDDYPYVPTSKQGEKLSHDCDIASIDEELKVSKNKSEIGLLSISYYSRLLFIKVERNLKYSSTALRKICV